MSNDTDKGSSENPDKPQDMSRDELEEALNWLENLASKQGKSLDGIAPLEDGPAEESPFKGLFESDEGDLPDWLREMPSDPDGDDLGADRASRLDWLARMANQESIEELPTLEWRQLSSYAEEINADEASQAETGEDLADLFDTPSPSQTTNLTASSLMIIAESAEEADTEPEAQLPVESEPAEMVSDEVINLPPPAVVAEDSLPEPEPEMVDLSSAEVIELPGEEEPGLADETAALVDPVVHPEPDDLDAAMAWLEELAASTDAPIEDLPSVADRALASKLMAEAVSGQIDQPDEAEATSSEAESSKAELSGAHTAPPVEPEEVEVPADMTSNSGLEPLVAMAAVEQVVADQIEHDPEPVAAEIVMDAVEPDEAVEEPASVKLTTEEILAHLDQMAIPSGQSLAAIEAHLATMPSAYLISPYTLDSTLDWLAGTDSTPAVGNQSATMADQLNADLVAAMPEDPDEALRWLESMAEADDLPLERDDRAETPSGTTLSSVEVTEADLLDMPDDPDEAMAWIENLASKGSNKQ